MQLCCSFVLLVVVCFASIPTIAVRLESIEQISSQFQLLNVSFSSPAYIPSFDDGGFASIFVLQNTLYVPSFFSLTNGQIESFLYTFDLQLNAQAQLNLTSVNQISYVGLKMFGDSQNNQIYFGQSNQIFQIDSNTLKTTSSPKNQQVLSYFSGFVDYWSGDLVFGFYNFSESGPYYSYGFVTIDPNTLQPLEFFAFNAPDGYLWELFPVCQASNVEQNVAYCQAELIDEDYSSFKYSTLRLSLTNFTVLSSFNRSGFISIAPANSSGECMVWSIYGTLNATRMFSFNVTGLTVDLQPVWTTSLSGLCDDPDGSVLVDDALLVSCNQGNRVFQFDSDSGQLIEVYTNPYGYALEFGFNSLPVPLLTVSGQQYLYSIGVPADESINYLVRIAIGE